MLFHPDRNPQGQEQFRRILTAYETLMDPVKRRSYDFRLRYQSNAQYTAQKFQTKKKKDESWEEKELKRRQYYNDYIRQFEKNTGFRNMEDLEKKTNYNEYKYILFATPLAVALFLLIMNLAAGSGPRKVNEFKTASVQPEIKMGDVPYLDHFGKQQYDLKNTSIFKLKNNSGKDAVICFFNDQDFVRSLFIKNGYSAQIAQLPDDRLEIRCFTGQNWKNDQALNKGYVAGGFSMDTGFYRTRTPVDLSQQNELELNSSANNVFIKIDELEFFKTINHDQKN